MEKCERPLVALEVEAHTGNTLPEFLKEKMGHSEWRGLSEQFGLTKLGANLEVLYPNSQSSIKHWHSESDEFVYIIEGDAVALLEGEEFLISKGMCIGFKANVEKGHSILNKSQEKVVFLVVGSRHKEDSVTYPDDDLQWLRDESGKMRAAKKDGSFY